MTAVPDNIKALATYVRVMDHYDCAALAWKQMALQLANFIESLDCFSCSKPQSKGEKAVYPKQDFHVVGRWIDSWRYQWTLYPAVLGYTEVQFEDQPKIQGPDWHKPRVHPSAYEEFLETLC